MIVLSLHHSLPLSVFSKGVDCRTERKENSPREKRIKKEREGEERKRANPNLRFVERERERGSVFRERNPQYPQVILYTNGR